MNTLKFKTNINCNGCLSRVKPVLDAEHQINTWNVDLQSEDRILTVEVEDMSAEDVKQTVGKVGFNAEEV